MKARTSRLLLNLAGLVTLCSAIGCGKVPSYASSADLVLLNAKIVTMSRAVPLAEALATQGDRILAVGSLKQIEPYISERTKVLDLGQQLVLPGFIEGHGHFLGIGEARQTISLTDSESWDDIVSKVKLAVQGKQSGEWIIGRGWHQEKWRKPPDPSISGLPFHDSLSAVSPDNPVILTHASGHACLANAKAMELAGVTSSTPDPEGGEIVRDSKGKPIGVFRETAQTLIRRPFRGFQDRRTSAAVERDLRRSIALATQECLSKGITTFHDAGVSYQTIDLLRTMASEGQLGIRLYSMLSEDNESLAQRMDQYRIIGVGSQHLTVRAIKRYMDGALGSHGAWLLEPYSDLPESSGLNTTSLESLSKTADLAIEHGFQLCIHAIGDRANREVLDLYQRTFRAHPGKRDLRWRIEHAQHLNPADIPRFAQLNVIAAMQGSHATSDGPWVIQRLGRERARTGAYVWQSLLDSGAYIVNGSDAPVEDVNPLFSYYASVTRKLSGGHTFFPEEKMTREEALRSFTLNAAFAAFEEREKGSLEAGKLADITVLDKDILEIPEEEIPTAEVVYTILGGRIAFQR